MRKHIFAVASQAVLLLLAGALLAGAQSDPSSLPAHDSHQGLLVAVDPYTSPARCKARFGKHNPCQGGILALDVFFRNDNSSPIRINLRSVRLQIGPPGQLRQRLSPISASEVADRTLGVLPNGPVPRRRRFPLPGSGPSSGKSKAWREMADLLDSLSLGTNVLAPHSTTHGFFYFDISHHFGWLSNARLEVPDLTFMTNDKALFFFEVNLGPGAR